MEFHTFGDADDPDLLYVLGWGNRVQHPAVKWLIDRLADAGFCVHAAEIPDNGTDFDRDYLDPATAYASELEEFHLLSHSTGGLVAAHLPAEGPRVYMSPFWGLTQRGVQAVLRDLLMRLPTDRQFLGGDFDPSILGEYKDPEIAKAGPDASPAWLRAMERAQQSLPAFRDGSVVFCSLTDVIVSINAIGEHAPADAVELYDGSHELFASKGREDYADRVVDALDQTGRLNTTST